MVSVDRLILKTPDGRQLEAMVSGPPDALPLVFHIGTPMGLVPLPSFLDPAQCGLKTVLYARPGYGSSSPHPGRSVGDAASDSGVVLDAIGADHFVTLGWSGGGAHALACAALLPERCLATAVVAGHSPFAVASQVYEAETAEFLGRIRAGDETELVKDCNASMKKLSGARAENLADNFTCAADHECMTGEFAEYLAASFRAAFTSGIEGVREDQAAFAHDWGFEVADARRVAIWHGAEDANMRVVHGAWLGDHIPDTELHILPHEGHVSIGLRFREIFDDLILRSRQIDRQGT